MFGGIGTPELVAFGILALMLFGARLPEVARNLGSTYRGLKKNVDEFKREFQAVETYEPKPRLTHSVDDDPPTVEDDAPRFSPPPQQDN